MSKRNRNKNKIPQQPKPVKMQKNAVAEKVENITGTKPESAVMDGASSEELGKIEALSDELVALKSKYESDFESLESDLAEIDQQREELKADRSKFETQVSEHQQGIDDAEQIREELLAKEKVLLKKEEDLAVREAQAQAGFVKQHSESLAELTAELSRLRSEHAQSLEQSQSNFILAQRSIDTEKKKLTEEIQGEWKKLEQAKQKLERELVALQEQQADLQSKESARETWESLKSEQLEQQFGNRISELESELERTSKYREREANRLMQLQNRLSDYAELERVIKQKEMDSADELLMGIEKLESDVREYKQKLAGRPVEDLEDEVDYLKDLNRTLEDQLRDTTQELHEANAERHQRAMGIMEREQLMMKNRVLEQHNDAIGLATEQLKREIEDLKDMQQGQAVFPALTRMDRELSENSITQPVPSLEELVDDLQVRIAQVDPDNPLYFGKDTLRLFIGGLAMSHLHILQGISGTGKTSLAKAFARAVGGQCTVVPVQAGWRDRDDLVGHYNAFEKRFYEKECLQALYRAQTPAFSDRFNVVLLDEMNLSRPEQYFAEFLSALELTGEDRQVVLMEDAPAKSPRFLRDGRKVPVADNLWFIGTANHDETTFEFADKTQDRSFVLELGRNDQENISSTLIRPVMYSVSSMRSTFQEAMKQHRTEVDRIFKTLQEHDITAVLEKRFGIGWGNRLERQARQFIPVVMAAGGTSSQALDHLLSVRLFRDGKVTGRYDTKTEHLTKLQGCLQSVWESVSKEGFAFLCEEKLEQEIERKEMA